MNNTGKTPIIDTDALRAENDRLRHDLLERQKELNCIFGISDIINPEMPLNEILQSIVHIIPSGWHYPEITCARLTHDGQEYLSDNFCESRWKQTSDVVVMGKRIGSLDVYYREEKPEQYEGPFIKEKRLLLNIIAEMLGKIIGRKTAEETIHQKEEIFRNLMEFIPGVSVQGYFSNGTVFYWNKASEEIYGYTAEEAKGKNLGDLIVPPDLKPFFTHCLGIGKIIRKSGEFVPSGELHFLHKKGHIVPVYSIHTSVYIEGQKPLLFCIDVDLSEQKKAEEKLKLAQNELEIKTKNLEESNTALKVLLEHHDREKKLMEKNIVSSFKTLILPYLEKIKVNTSDERIKTYIDIVETNISEIAKPYTNQINEYFSLLTPTEIQILNLIYENKTAKDIAGILDISETTVFFHRRNIRNKLGIRNKKTNLRSFVQSTSGKQHED